MYSTPDICWIHQNLEFKDRDISKKDKIKVHFKVQDQSLNM